MDSRQKVVLNVLRRIQRFLDEHSGVLSSVNRTRARIALDDLVFSAELAEGAQRRAAARSKRLTAQRKALRRQLRAAHLRPIIAFARAKGEVLPVLSCMGMPSKDAPDLELMIAARAIATMAVQKQRVFLDEGFPLDFVERLVAAIAAMEAAESECSRCRMEGRRATVILADLIKRGRGLSRVIDALVVARIADNARLMAVWRAASSRKNH